MGNHLGLEFDFVLMALDQTSDLTGLPLHCFCSIISSQGMVGWLGLKNVNLEFFYPPHIGLDSPLPKTFVLNFIRLGRREGEQSNPSYVAYRPPPRHLSSRLARRVHITGATLLTAPMSVCLLSR